MTDADRTARDELFARMDSWSRQIVDGDSHPGLLRSEARLLRRLLEAAEAERDALENRCSDLEMDLTRANGWLTEARTARDRALRVVEAARKVVSAAWFPVGDAGIEEFWRAITAHDAGREGES